MENAEEVLQMLERYDKFKPKDIPGELEEYLIHVAKSGDTVFSWSKVRFLFIQKLSRVIEEFYESTQNIEIPQYPNVDPFNYDVLRENLVGRLSGFPSAPFTIQRLCELLTEPRRQYNRIDKYMRALEKNLSVVSTIEPGRRQADSENSDSMDSVSRGDLSFDINVDIDMENGSIFNLQQGSGGSAQNNSISSYKNVAATDSTTEKKDADSVVPTANGESSAEEQTENETDKETTTAHEETAEVSEKADESKQNKDTHDGHLETPAKEEHDSVGKQETHEEHHQKEDSDKDAEDLSEEKRFSEETAASDNVSDGEERLQKEIDANEPVSPNKTDNVNESNHANFACEGESTESADSDLVSQTEYTTGQTSFSSVSQDNASSNASKLEESHHDVAAAPGGQPKPQKKVDGETDTQHVTSESVEVQHEDTSVTGNAVQSTVAESTAESSNEKENEGESSKETQQSESKPEVAASDQKMDESESVTTATEPASKNESEEHQSEMAVDPDPPKVSEEKAAISGMDVDDSVQDEAMDQ